MLISIGLCIGYFTCYGTANIPSSLSWRLPLVLQSVIAMGLTLISFFYLPESPRWLTARGKPEDAALVWDQLGVLAAEQEKVEEQSVTAGSGAQRAQPRTVEKLTWQQRMAKQMIIFGKEGRKQMTLGVFMMAMQQLSGIDGVLYV